MNLHLVSVVGGSSETLAMMIDHYRSFGIESIHIHVHATSPEDPCLEQLKQIVRDKNAKIASVNICPWSQTVNPMLYRLSRSNAPNDWFIVADHDEFHTYSDELPSLLRFCDSRGYDYVEGCFIDRIASDGALPKVSSGISIWEQFPLGACLSGPLIGAMINKVVLSKGHVVLGPGQHLARSGRRCPANEIYIPVHHFKWTSSVLDRLRKRVIERKQLREAVWIESARFLEYFERTNRIDITDPRFLVATCTPEYRHWPKLVEWKLASSYFNL